MKDKGKKTKDERRKTKINGLLGAAVLALAVAGMAAVGHAANLDGGPGDGKADQPDHKDPTDVRNMLDNMSLVRDFAKLPKAHEKKSLADQLADQPYYTPMMRAQKQLFHGKYAEAEKGFESLLGTPLTDAERATASVGYLEAILAQGHQRDISRFDSALATMPEGRRQLPAVLVLRARALMESGKLGDAGELLRAYIQKNPSLTPLNADTLSLFNLYGSILELTAQYAVAGDLYGKIVELAKDEMPDDPGIQTQYAIALHRFSVLTLQARRYNEDVKSRLQHVLDVDETYWPAELELAKLLLEAHNDKDGGAQIQATLELNPNCCEAKLILVKWATENYDFEQATAGLQELREHSDSAEIPEAEGRLLLKQRLPEQAIGPLNEAVRLDPNLPEARGLLAGAYYLRSDSLRADEQLGAIAAPQGGPHPEALFEAAEILRDARQFTRAEKLYLQAGKSASWWGEPFAALAQLYLETGQETKAKAAYDESFKIDPYNMRASNQLRLLDYLKQFASVETPHFIIRYAAKADLADPNSTAKTQDRILAELAGEWMEKVYPEVCGYFQAYPEVKTQVELFPSHEEFGVRTTGLPWIGTVGACTGNVIAMDVPRGGAKNTMGAFDWARVMRHEFTHTVTLYMTDNRIPHWLTEAAACVQEQAPRDWEDCQLLAMNYRSGKLFKYQDLNWGFIRPKRSIDRMLAYRQSEWIYQYIVEVYGQPTMLKFLHCFKDGLTESQALQATFGRTPDTFNQDFLEWAGKQIAGWGIPTDPLPSAGDAKTALDAHPDDPKLMFQLASAEIGAGKVADDTVALLRHALEKDPKYSAARELLGFVLHHQKKDAEARQMFEQVVQEDPHRPVTLRTLGQMAMETENFDEAEKWFLQLQQVRPLESTSYENLAGIYLIQHKYGPAIAQLTELQRHEQKDERIPRKLAELYRQNQQLDDAAQMAYKSIRINPYNPINHNLMGQILLQQNQPGKAIEYFKYATDLADGVPQFWAGLADAQGQSGDTKDAEESAKKAVELDPKSPAMKWIK